MVLDSSYMASPPAVATANPLDTMMESLRAQIAAEVKSDISGEIINRVIRLVGTAFQNQQISLTPSITLPPSPIEVNVPAPLVDVEFDLSELKISMDRTNTLLERLILIMSQPVERDVKRDSENLIQSIIERRI